MIHWRQILTAAGLKMQVPATSPLGRSVRVRKGSRRRRTKVSALFPKQHLHPQCIRLSSPPPILLSAVHEQYIQPAILVEVSGNDIYYVGRGSMFGGRKVTEEI